MTSPSSPPNQADRRIVGVVVGLLAVALIVVIIVIGVLVARQVSESIGAGAAVTTEATPESSPDATVDADTPEETETADTGDPTPETDTPSDPDALTDAEVEGWQGVLVRSRPFVYDVPADWIVRSPGMISGFEEEDPDAPFGYSPTVGMSGVAVYAARAGDCEYVADPAVAGTSSSEGLGDTAERAEAMATDWAEAAYGNDAGDPELTVGAAEPFTENGLDGHRVTVEVAPATEDCYPEQAQVQVVSVADPDRNMVDHFILYADVTGDEAAPQDDLDVIVSSLRPQEDWEDPNG
ncbi:hypothetical protein RIF23_19615 [Lipingzhangella sp. LS1_29]|uniref:DUF8017 domain-containing protein n=1 Tax=Lipingzhangella rawalii TaxID=2055835 RepID=A0ABU2HB01_9ACTN|nr:hypothetical protein [Lipingzhangella rawalii]MDS1272500.1 hypothetical protein [Lipingzhangella rawalii]